MKPITELKYKLSESSVDALRSIIGEVMHTIYAPELSIATGNNLVSSYSFAISLENGFLNLWTKEIDGKSIYWQMHVERGAKPKNIVYEMDDQFNKYVLDHPSSIDLKSSSKLVSIEIYSDRDTQTVNTESDTLYSTYYDHSVVFVLENGDKFCISVDTGMPDDTVMGYDEKGINILLKDLTLRQTI